MRITRNLTGTYGGDDWETEVNAAVEVPGIELPVRIKHVVNVQAHIANGLEGKRLIEKGL